MFIHEDNGGGLGQQQFTLQCARTKLNDPDSDGDLSFDYLDRNGIWRYGGLICVHYPPKFRLVADVYVDCFCDSIEECLKIAARHYAFEVDDVRA